MAVGRPQRAECSSSTQQANQYLGCFLTFASAFSYSYVKQMQQRKPVRRSTPPRPHPALAAVPRPITRPITRGALHAAAQPPGPVQPKGDDVAMQAQQKLAEADAAEAQEPKGSK